MFFLLLICSQSTMPRDSSLPALAARLTPRAPQQGQQPPSATLRGQQPPSATLPTLPLLGSLLLAACITSLPMFRGPRWLKSIFARAARSMKRVPAWHFTPLAGTNLVIGAVPTADEQLRELQDDGVTAVVTMNQAWEPQAPGGVQAACGRVGLAHLQLPTPDYSSPSQRDIRRAVDFIGAHVDEGGKVYVHCNAGRGRSAVCVLAYLMASGGLSAGEAYELVAAQRRITNLPSRLLGFRRPQWRALRRYEAALAKRGAATRREEEGGKS